MSNRVYNFNPGPAALPLEVLEKAQSELLNYRDSGMSVMEISHRSREFETIITEAENLMLDLYGLSDRYQVLFLQGGASFQFAMIPYNFLSPGKTADYVITGSFAEKAWKEASRLGTTHVAASSREDGFQSIPAAQQIKPSSDPAYIHITTNNTIYGTQWHYTPETGAVPLIADMSSDILSRPQDMTRFSLVYAGAQKNLGPSGVTVVIIRKDMLETVEETLPAILNYRVHAEANSLYNTPPCFAVYMVKEVLEWVKQQGGLGAVGARNEEKAALIYKAVDESGGFYCGHAVKEDRSIMNATFRLPDEALEKDFLQEAASRKMTGLKGHRSVGGIRASIYNAMPLEGCQALAELMKDFVKSKG